MGAGASGGSPVPHFGPSHTIISLSPCLQLTMLVLQLWPTITLSLIFLPILNNWHFSSSSV